MNIKLINITILLGLFFLTGCQNNPSKSTEDIKITTHYPDWYQNPPSDTPNTLYGLGEGKTANAAIDDALRYLSAKLSVSVSSTSQINKSFHSGAYQYAETTLNKQTQTSIKAIQINQFEQVNLKQIGYARFVALIKSDKQKLANSFRNKLTEQMNYYKNDSSINNNPIGYAQYLAIKAHYQTLDNFTANLAIYQSLRPQSSSKQLTRFIAEVEKTYATKLDNTQFKIKSNNQRFQQALTNFLKQQGFKVGNDKNSTDKIILNTSNNKTKSNGFFITRITTDLTYQNLTTETAKQIFLKGQGINQQQAEDNSLQKFIKYLNSQELTITLGIAE